MKISRLSNDQFNLFYELVCSMIAESEFDKALPDKNQIYLMTLMPNLIVFLAEKDNKLIGFIAGITQKYFFSDRMKSTDMGFFVLPEYRGSSAAIRLVQAFEKWSKDQGVEDICFGQTTAIDIEKTQRFYTHLGYKTVGFNTVKHLH